MIWRVMPAMIDGSPCSRCGERGWATPLERPPAAGNEGHDERDGALAVPPALPRSPEAESASRRALPHRRGRLPEGHARPHREGSGSARPRRDHAPLREVGGVTDGPTGSPLDAPGTPATTCRLLW